MHPSIRRAHELAMERFFSETAGLFYGIENPDDPAGWSSPEEVSTEKPGKPGAGAGLPDVCLDSGWRLDGFLCAHRVTGDAEWADKARRVFYGLVWLAETPGVPGFVPRGIYPGRTEFYPHSSRDQYTSFVFSMWRFATSGLATEEERAKAAELVVNVCRRIEAHDHNIVTSNGDECIHGDLNMVRPGGSDRLLMFYKAAHALSGDAHWQELYRRKIHEEDGMRLQTLGWGPAPIAWNKNIHGRFQTQTALKLLLACETDADARLYALKAINEQADAVMSHLELWHLLTRPMWGVYERSAEEVWQDYQEVFTRYFNACPERVYRPGVETWYRFMRDNRRWWPAEDEHTAKVLHCPLTLPKLRHLIEATATVMLCEDVEKKREAAEKAWPYITAVDWDGVHINGATCFLESAYWRGVEAGVFPRH